MEICHPLEVGAEKNRRLHQLLCYRDRGKGLGGGRGESEDLQRGMGVCSRCSTTEMVERI